jgi:peptide/nickel transport system permease protein
LQRYLAIRIFHSFLTLIVVSFLVFGMGRISGNVLDVLLPDDATPADFERLTKRWGLDKPIPVQYWIFIRNAAQGDFGDSLTKAGRTSMGLVIERLPATIQLAAFSLAISTLLAIPIGVLSAVKRDSPFDFFGKIIALLGQSVPSFWLGLMMMWVFAVQLGWLPSSGKGGIEHLVMPAIALGLFQVAAVMRLLRSSMLDVLDSEYVKLARIKGLPEWKVIWKHCLRNAAIAPLTYYGVIAGSLLTGSVITEQVFQWPGTGLLAIEAVRNRDYPVMQSVVIVFAGIFVLCNLIVDILYAYLDPQIRYES